MARLSFTLQAEQDLAEILDFIAQDNPPAAQSFLGQLEEKCWTLAAYPHMGQARESLGSGVQSFPAGRYVIFYRSIPDGIQVLRVLHGARDVENIF